MKKLVQRLRHAGGRRGSGHAFRDCSWCFRVQIAARYLFNVPMGWTVEVCLTLWLWIVFWGGAFCLRPADHIRFDVLYLSVNRPTQDLRRHFGGHDRRRIRRRFPAHRRLRELLQDQAQQYAGIRLHYVFSIYLLFMVVVMARYSGVHLNFLRGKEEVEENQLLLASR